MNRLVSRYAAILIRPSTWAVLGAAAPDRGLEIMREVERLQLTDSQSNDGAIEVVDGKGKVLNKSWHFTREGNRGRSKVLIRFTAPPEVRGVGFLTLNHPDKPAEQWLYTPAIQRDRRVAPQEKSQRFMGTDFSHEDIEERSIENYDYALMGEESLGGEPAYKIRAVYKDRASNEDRSFTSGSVKTSWPRRSSNIMWTGSRARPCAGMTGNKSRESGLPTWSR